MDGKVNEIDPQLEAELKALACTSGGKPLAIKRYCEATGCAARDGFAWLYRYMKSLEPVVPCPHCGQALRSPKAKQCFDCGMDWHDSSQIVRRGNGDRGELPGEPR